AGPVVRVNRGAFLLAATGLTPRTAVVGDRGAPAEGLRRALGPGRLGGEAPVAEQDGDEVEGAHQRLQQVPREGGRALLPNGVAGELDRPGADGDRHHHRPRDHLGQREAEGVENRHHQGQLDVQAEVPRHDCQVGQVAEMELQAAHRPQRDPAQHRHDVKDDERDRDLVGEAVHRMPMHLLVFLEKRAQLRIHVGPPGCFITSGRAENTPLRLDRPSAGRYTGRPAERMVTMEPESIQIRGAREHNLKDVDVDIPKKKLVVITGVSGSGKSSLAFDTLYAEGQRRYVESLSSYARQFLGQMKKPKYDTIRGLSPTISIEQKAASSNPRSTVGTVTEILDYLRVLYASIGVQHCTNCGRRVGRQSAQQIVKSILAMPEGSRVQILAPLVIDRRGEHREILEDAVRRGFARMRVDGRIVDLASERVQLDKKLKHDLE